MKKRGVLDWFQRNRDTARLAYVLQLATRLLSGLLGLVWVRLLVGAMGVELNGLLILFQKVVTLGGAGDLGMGGAVGIRVGQYIGQRKETELQKFLASARAMFLVLAVVAGGGIILLSPWLPLWLDWKPVAGSGSLTMLFVVGAVLVAGVLLSSYLSSVNYACGNVMWPILPTFALLQLGLLGNWLLARQQVPLWVQCLPYIATAAAGIILLKYYVRVSHPALARLWPLSFDWRMAVTLLVSSFWVYLCTLGNVIYRTTDSLVIVAGFDTGTVPFYEYNYRLCELVVFLALTASFVTMPRITQWMASPEPREQERARLEIRRLNQFQTLLGCGAALAYLAINNLFMRIWLGDEGVAAAQLELQLAFAMNMVVTTSGDAGIQLMGRCGKTGIRTAGLTIAITGLVNLGLSLVAMNMQSLLGIALATVLAQSLLSLTASFYTCRHLKMNWLPWLTRSWLVPIVGICFAGWMRQRFPFHSPENILLPLNVAMVVGAYAAMFFAAAWTLGINGKFIRDELKIVRAFFKK